MVADFSSPEGAAPTAPATVPAGWWRAPQASGPLQARVSLPGSKSQTARELVLCALAGEPSRLHGALHSRDSDLLVAALQACGVQIKPWKSEDWKAEDWKTEFGATAAGKRAAGGEIVTVSPPPQLGSDLPLTFIDCGLAGTVMRFVPPVVALGRGHFRFSGDAQAAQRPLLPLLGALQDLGVPIELPGAKTGGASGPSLPFVMHPTGSVRGGRVELDASASSQFVSALLLAAPRFTQGLDLSVVGQVPSLPHIEMTIEALARRGVVVHRLTEGGHLAGAGAPVRRWRVSPGRIRGGSFHIEPDLSNAGPFLAAALLAGGEVTVENWPQSSTQAGKAWEWILPKMGAQLRNVGGELTARSTGKILPLDADLSQVGELVPTVAALAAFATGPSVLRSVGHLRGHETDRLAALENELKKAGATARVLGQDLHISPVTNSGQNGGKQSGGKQSGGKQSGAPGAPAVQLRSYADHRLATFAALVGLRLPVILDDVGATTKTLPTFTALWEQMLQSAGGADGKDK